MRRTSALSCARTTGRGNWKRRWRTSKMLRRAHASRSRSSLSTTTRGTTRKRSSVVRPEPRPYPFATCSSARRACPSPAIADCRKRTGSIVAFTDDDCVVDPGLDRRALRRVRGRSGRRHRRRPRRLVLAGRSAGVDPSDRRARPLHERDADLRPRHGLQSRGSTPRGRTDRRVRSRLRRKQRRRRGRHRLRLPRVRSKGSASCSRPPRECCTITAAEPMASCARSARSYVRGKGAFFCKHVLRADRTILRHAWWEIRARHGRSGPQSTVAPRDPRRTRVRSDPLRADARETRPAMTFRLPARPPLAVRNRHPKKEPPKQRGGLESWPEELQEHRATPSSSCGGPRELVNRCRGH